MKLTTKTIKSPYFPNQTREINIWEPKKIDKNTPVLFFYDGQILQKQISPLQQKNKIDIFNHLKILNKFIIVTVNSMSENSQTKYEDRWKELKNLKNNKFCFGELIKKKILILKKKYKGIWFGFGFSLSGWLLGKQPSLFDHRILISPYFQKDIFNLGKSVSIIYGKKEYKFWSYFKINNPIRKIRKKNKKHNFIEIKKLKHNIYSWNKYFSFILKATVVPYLEFHKIGLNGTGKFINGNSNISLVNKNKHFKIKANNVLNIGLEKKFIRKTKYKKDYKFINDKIFIKNFYNSKTKKKLNKNEIIFLARELKSLHSIKISKEIPKYQNMPFNDDLVMSHGDINPKNVLFNKKRCIFIDFEWAQLNSKYWDICSIFLLYKLNKKQKKLFEKKYNFAFEKSKIKLMTKHLKKVIKNFNINYPNYFITT